MFIRYNQPAKYWEYDTSVAQNGTGPWLILPVDFSQLVNVPPITPVPPNIAFTNVTNQFTATQVINGASIAELNLNDTAVSFLLRILNYQGRFQIYYNPVGALLWVDAAGNTGIKNDLYVGGVIREKVRTVGLGYWQDVPFNAANFIALSGGGTWTVGVGSIVRNRFTVIGMTMIWDIYLSWFSGASAVAGNVVGVGVNIPAGFSSPGNNGMDVSRAFDASGEIDVVAGASAGQLGFSKRNNTPFAVGQIGFIGTFVFEIAGAGVNIELPDSENS